MLHSFFEKGPWFRAKRFGYGAGLPFKWQGWAVLAVYALVIFGVVLSSHPDGPLPKAVGLVLMIIVTTIFIFVTKSRTEGGWRWGS